MKLFLLPLCLAIAAICLPFSPVHAQSGVLLKTFGVKAGKLLLDPGRPQLYATLPQDDGLTIVDTDTNRIKTTLRVGSHPVDMSISLDGTRLYVVNSGPISTAIDVIDLTTLTTLPSLPAPFQPSSVAAGLDNRLYLLGSGYSNGVPISLAQIDATTGAVEVSFGSAEGGSGSLQISPDGHVLFCESIGFSKYDVSTATPNFLQGARYDSDSSQMTLSHDGRFFVSPRGSGNGNGTPYQTYLISANDLDAIVASFDVGPYPGPAVFSLDDNLFYEVQAFGGNGTPNAFKVFSTSAFTLLDTFDDPGTSGGFTLVTSLAVTEPRGYLYVAESVDGYGKTAGNLRLISTRRAPFFDDSVALSGGFYYLKFSDGVPFGYYNLDYSPYVYHSDLGFVYPFDAIDDQGGIYLYDFKSKTFWFTSHSLFPYLYDFTLHTFLYYYPDPDHPDHYNTSGLRFFYNFATGKIIFK